MLFCHAKAYADAATGNDDAEELLNTIYVEELITADYHTMVDAFAKYGMICTFVGATSYVEYEKEIVVICYQVGANDIIYSLYFEGTWCGICEESQIGHVSSSSDYYYITLLVDKYWQCTGCTEYDVERIEYLLDDLY